MTAHVQSYRTLHISLENRHNKKAIDFTPKLLIDSVKCCARKELSAAITSSDASCIPFDKRERH